MGWSARIAGERVAQNPNLVNSLVGMRGGRVAPNTGGLLLRDAANVIMGVVGVSGDTGDNAAIVAIAGIEAGRLNADAGGARK